MSHHQVGIESCKSGFDWDAFKSVQKETIEVLHRIASKIQIGMLETDAYEIAKSTLKESGFEKNWHRPYVRFGANTTLMFGKPSPPETRLRENDLFYLDIGPVKDGYEGDAGDTFLVGQIPEMEKCILDTRKLFFDVQDYWRRSQSSGQDLYRFARKQAEKMGWMLNPEWDGHRLADFPHQVYFKGRLAEVDFSPASGLWVLEIHLCDPKGRFGAFYEDLLLEG